jgi:hypothetical protein
MVSQNAGKRKSIRGLSFFGGRGTMLPIVNARMVFEQGGGSDGAHQGALYA